jgi:hypothetical protein
LEPTVVYKDNSTCSVWLEDSAGCSDSAKHIELLEHFVHDTIKAKMLKLEAVTSEDHIANLLT